MPMTEIMRHYRRRDWIAAAWNALKFGVELWRIKDPDPDYNTSLKTALAVAWDIERDRPRINALKRACRARGYPCIPYNLRYEVKP